MEIIYEIHNKLGATLKWLVCFIRGRTFLRLVCTISEGSRFRETPHALLNRVNNRVHPGGFAKYICNYFEFLLHFNISSPSQAVPFASHS